MPTDGAHTACAGWHQHRRAVLVTLYDMIAPEDGAFLGEVDHLGEARVIMVWLIDGSIHLISDCWIEKDMAIGSKKFLVLGSHEPALLAPSRDWPSSCA